MKKLNEKNIFEKQQHRSILYALVNYPDGLSFHELTFLLTTRQNIRNMSELDKRFNPHYPHKNKIKRENIFKTRQRINICLNDLKKFQLIFKNEQKKYKVNLLKILLLLIAIHERKEAEKLAKEFITDATHEITKMFNELNKLSGLEREKELKNLIIWYNKEGYFSSLEP